MGQSKTSVRTILATIFIIVFLETFLGTSLGTFIELPRLQTKSRDTQVQSAKTTDVPVLSLDALSESATTTETISGLQSKTGTGGQKSISINDLTKLVFSSSRATTNGSEFPLNLHSQDNSMLLEGEEIMENMWNHLREQSKNESKIMWLVDLIGDSFARDQYTQLETFVRGKRPFQDDTIYGTMRQTYHNHHIFCCPSNVNATCTLRLQKFSFRGGNIHKQIENQVAQFDKSTEAPDGVICISWQWSKYANDLGFGHLKRHTDSALVPIAVVMNQGLHCAFRKDWNEFCTPEFFDALANITKEISASRGTKFIFDTASAVFNVTHPEKTNRTTSELNADIANMNRARRTHFTSKRWNTGNNSHVWLRDIESLSKAFHNNPDCVKEDGVHIICDLFNKISATWLLNYAVGKLVLNPSDPSTLLPLDAA